MNNENSVTRWALIDPDSLTCREFTTIPPAGRFHPSLRWLQVPEALASFADHAYVEQDGEIAPPSLDYLKSQVKREVTALRWLHETSGLTLPNGIHILTAKDDQERVNSVLTNMERYQVTEVDFKSASGWVRATYDDVKGIGAAIMQHVQTCFSAEREHHDAVDALDSIEAVTAYDYAPAWPSGAP